jgi:mannonate dehydratase
VFDNLAYFLKALVPAAEKADVRMALHPDDPPVPTGTPPLAGAAHIASTFDQYHKIFDIVPSRSNGMLFCQGCVKEMQGVDVYDAIHHMGSIDKIVMVHFRNVRGSFPRFQETFVDNGDVDMFRAMEAYRDGRLHRPLLARPFARLRRRGDCEPGVRHRLYTSVDSGGITGKARCRYPVALSHCQRREILCNDMLTRRLCRVRCEPLSLSHKNRK